jgi:hypothetical protein
MLPISLPYVYNLSSELQGLRRIQFDKPLKEARWYLLQAENELNVFLTGSVYIHTIRACVAPGRELLQAIKKLSTEADQERILDFFDVYSVTQSLEKFEAVFTAELNVTTAYLVTKKRGYDTSDLVARAEVLFPAELQEKIPECITDIREAGKCIAFEMGTSAGFHILRATELVMRKYWDAVTKGAERPTNGSMGVYLHEMEQQKAGDEKVIAALRQIKDLHRNVLMHPEENLTLDDAIALLGISQSAIVAMLREIPDPPAPALVLESS